MIYRKPFIDRKFWSRPNDLTKRSLGEGRNRRGGRRWHTWEAVDLDGVVDGSGGKGVGAGTEGEGSDPVLVVADLLGELRRVGGVMDGDGAIGGVGRDEVAAVGVPQDRTERG